MSSESGREYLMSPQEFLDKGASLGVVGDIRELELAMAVNRMQSLDTVRDIGHVGMALLGLRDENEPGTLILPAHGLIYPIYPSPEPEAEWHAFRQDFIHTVRAPGHLHAYDADAYALPI